MSKEFPLNRDNREAPRRRFWVWLCGAAIVGIGISAIVRSQISNHHSRSKADVDLASWQEGLPSADQWSDDASTASFQGDGSNAGYVGTQACQSCHESQFESYLQTTHSKAFRETDPRTEPEDGRFSHDRSSRYYEIYRTGGDLHHRETLLGKQGQMLAVTDIPIKYTVGSGSHAITYLWESNGLLFESPVTWYGGVGWGLSPGYDRSTNPGFTRNTNESCVFCHVGMIERSVENAEKIRIVEQAIGCERCHGPGESHLAFHQNENGKRTDDHTGSDDPIVQPAKLSRELSEAICQQCHMQGLVVVTAAGKHLWDFRPGESLVENRTDFQIADENKSKIVGHFEQMYQSACYQGSETLTCITCHDPHHQALPENSVDFHRKICLDCHAPDSCGIDSQERHRKNENNCAGCHMPKNDTNIPHMALNHHRIGIHKPHEPATTESSESELVPLLADGMSDEELKRRTDLAVQYAMMVGTPVKKLQTQLRDSIGSTYERVKAGQADVHQTGTLARSAMNMGNHDLARTLATKVLQESLPGSLESNDARNILADLAFRAGENAIALDHFRELTRLRQNANDYAMLGLCLRNAGESEAAIEALRKSLTIQPDLVMVHETLASLLAANGDDRAQVHQAVSRAIVTP